MGFAVASLVLGRVGEMGVAMGRDGEGSPGRERPGLGEGTVRIESDKDAGADRSARAERGAASAGLLVGRDGNKCGWPNPRVLPPVNLESARKSNVAMLDTVHAYIINAPLHFEKYREELP